MTNDETNLQTANTSLMKKALEKHMFALNLLMGKKRLLGLCTYNSY